MENSNNMKPDNRVFPRILDLLSPRFNAFVMEYIWTMELIIKKNPRKFPKIKKTKAKRKRKRENEPFGPNFRGP